MKTRVYYYREASRPPATVIPACLLAAGAIVAFVLPVSADEPKEPKGPAATAEVRLILDEAERLLDEKNAEAALAAADRALALARENQDDAGEAFAHRERANALGALGRTDDALGAWLDAANSWESQEAVPERIQALCARVFLFARVRDSQSMNRELERVVTIASVEQDRPQAAVDALNDASSRMWRIRQLQASEKLARSAVAIAEGHAVDPLALAMSLNSLGVVAAVTGELETAQRLFQRTLEIRMEHDPVSLAVASALNNLGNVASERPDLDAARDYYSRALEIREVLAPGSMDVAMSLNNLGVVAAKQEDLETARDYYRRSLETKEKLRPGSLTVAASLINLGNVAAMQKDLEAALGYLRRSLEIQEKLAPGSVAHAACLNTLGNVAVGQGEFDAAREYFGRSLDIRGKLKPGSVDVATSLNNLGNVASKQGDLDAARDYYRRSLAIKEELAPGSLAVATSLNNIGVIAEEQGDLDGALDYHRRALAIKEELVPDSLLVGTSLSNLGIVARKKGDLEAARAYHRRTLEINERLAPDSLAVAGSLNNLGIVARLQGDLEAALDYHRRSLTVRERFAPGSLQVAMSLRNLGLIARDQDDHEAARESFARAWSVIRSQARSVTGDEAWSAFAERHAIYAANLIRAEVRIGRFERALDVLEESRAQGLLALFERRGLGKSAATELWRSYKVAERRRDQLGESLAEASSRVAVLVRDFSDLEAQGIAGDELTSVREELSRERTSREDALSNYTQARLEVQARLAEVRGSVHGLEPEEFSLGSAREILSRGTVFIAFVVGVEATIAVFVPSDPEVAVRGRVIDLTAEQLTKRIEFVRDRLGVGRVERGLALAEKSRLESASRSLFRKLFPEDVRAVLDTAERVVISPDGPLWHLPFAALEMGADGDGAPRWLGLEKSLSYAPSLTTLAHAKRRAVPTGEVSVLVLGDPMPATDDEKSREVPTPTDVAKEGASSEASLSNGERTRLFPNGGPLEPLPGAREEARRLAKLYETEPLIGLEATENVVRARLPQATIVHLATHGYFHPTQPMSSGVLLAPPKDKAATGTDFDGALQAWEILSALDLRADLVVLSACETGLGRAVRGEGLVGLTRALQAAGANSVVATHWKVADDSTTELMVSFHEKLRAGVRKDDALREAMREAAGRKETSHPYFWAAFFLNGGSE